MAPYSITSSARPSREIGTEIPNALAVLRLRVSSTFVACCTDRTHDPGPRDDDVCARIAGIWGGNEHSYPTINDPKLDAMASVITGKALCGADVRSRNGRAKVCRESNRLTRFRNNFKH
jgi:hypothetical protein